ncbi:hypothetical protein HPB51_008626 [Rhipicephalus microplus]|uniref:Apple domain-containing protein n=1 Tax=Rhipicephalus microplus TaxID=6941 RepID=A0A9J6ENK0_RHIMP|nr:hypothetical protein HPB51_008626 [Rhipicephalus microplus]
MRVRSVSNRLQSLQFTLSPFSSRSQFAFFAASVLPLTFCRRLADEPSLATSLCLRYPCPCTYVTNVWRAKGSHVDCSYVDVLLNNATFECYRRKRLDGSHQVEVKAYSFHECLDECMRRYSRDCRSVEYSSRYQMCRFSSYDGQPRPNLVDDDYYDFYEFKWCKYDAWTQAHWMVLRS